RASVLYVRGDSVRVHVHATGKPRTVPLERVTPKREIKALSVGPASDVRLPDGVAWNFINAHWRAFGIPSAVLSGTCHGVDQAGERWAEKRRVPVERYPAEWYALGENGKPLGKSAGPRRNAVMAAKAD